MDLKTALNTIRCLKDIDWSYEKLDGWSNHTYLLAAENKRCVLRLPVEGVAPWIDRHAELEHIKQVKALDITPRTVYFDPHTGVQVRQFEPGHIVPDSPDQITDTQLDTMAKVLKKLHDSDVVFKPVDIFEVILSSYQTVEPLMEDMRYQSLYQYTLQVAKIKSDFETKPCHMDPTPHNFLETPKGMMLIDFEYAGACDPTWDLAYTITHANLSETQEATLLKAYGVSDEQAHLVNILKPITQLLQAIWILLQFHVNHFPVDKTILKQWEQGALDKAFGMLFS